MHMRKHSVAHHQHAASANMSTPHVNARSSARTLCRTNCPTLTRKTQRAAGTLFDLTHCAFDIRITNINARRNIVKLKALALSTILLGAVAASPASAVPAVAKIDGPAAQMSQVEKTQIRKNRRANRNRNWNRNRYSRNRFRAGRSYRSAPRGWRRYSSRPYNYRARGCVIIGPVWFCP